MTSLVDFQKQGAIGVITLNNPPVNALSVNKDFFNSGNEFIKQRFPQGLPWNEIRSATIL